MDVFDTLVAQFGQAAKDSLNGPGEPEAALATPVDNLLREYGEKILSRKVVLHAEVREDSGNVRPDFGVRIDGLMSGHVELKKPETSLDPDTYSKSSHNGRQWKRLSKLPNLLHTNGLEWRLWRYGETRGHSALTGVLVNQVQRRYCCASGARHRIVELFVLDSHTDYNSYSPSRYHCTTCSVVA